jgi:hypothetical protein
MTQSEVAAFAAPPRMERLISGSYHTRPIVPAAPARVNNAKLSLIRSRCNRAARLRAGNSRIIAPEGAA